MLTSKRFRTHAGQTRSRSGRALLATAAFLSAPLLIAAGGSSRLQPFPPGTRASASDTLYEKGKRADFYAARRVIDGKASTSWCSGKKPPTGLSITIIPAKPIRIFGMRPPTGGKLIEPPFLLVANGYGRNRKLHLANNRVKDFSLELHYERPRRIRRLSGRLGKSMCQTRKDIDEYCSNVYGDNPESPSPLFGKKIKGMTHASCMKHYAHACVTPPVGGLHDDTAYGSRVVIPEGHLKKVVLTIKSVYRGSRYRDTCISDIFLFNVGAGL